MSSKLIKVTHLLYMLCVSDLIRIYMESMKGGRDTSRVCHVVAMPYPGRGHINPMMNLCKLLVSKSNNIIVSFIVTEEWHGFLASASTPPSIRFETIPNVIPSELVRADDFAGFIQAVMTKLEGPFEQVLDRILLSVTAIVTDIYLPWTVAVANRRKITVASLYPMSPTVFSICSHFDLVVQRGPSPADLSECGDERIDYIPGISSLRLADLPMIFSETGQAVLPDLTEYISWARKAQCLILASFYELEPQVTDSLKSTLPFPAYSVGPLIPYLSHDNLKTHKEDIDYFKWLDSQPPKSVLYISLGSFLSVSREQMDEIVAGVRGSRVRYLLVARGDSSHIQEACGVTGLVVPWCDQLKVLCHSSVGGFWTHCGWNSTLEGVFAGVPMLTFPIIFDQITDGKLIVDDWKIGVKVKEVATGKLVKREEIAIIVKKFMDLKEDESKEMRRRASDLQEKCRQAVAKGGSSDENLDAFIREILHCHV